jgi:tryptophan 2-monooxygenase
VLCDYELMRMGVHPVLYESGKLGGRLRSQTFEGADGVTAELGGMVSVSSTGFYPTWTSSASKACRFRIR